MWMACHLILLFVAPHALYNMFTLQYVHLATRALYNPCTFQHVHFATCAPGNLCTLHPVHFSTCAVCNMCTLQPVHFTTRAPTHWIDQFCILFIWLKIPEGGTLKWRGRHWWSCWHWRYCSQGRGKTRDDGGHQKKWPIISIRISIVSLEIAQIEHICLLISNFHSGT